MREPGLDTILAELKAGLADVYGDRLKHVILYGSQARGDATPDSDIDVLVVLDGPVEPMQEIDRTLGLVGRLCRKYTVLIACAFASTSEYGDSGAPLFVNARREGVAL